MYHFLGAFARQGGMCGGHQAHGPVNGYMEVSFRKESPLCHRNKMAIESALVCDCVSSCVWTPAVSRLLCWAAEPNLQGSSGCPWWTCLL